MNSKNLSSNLFDIRPTKKDGSLDIKKIQRVKKVLDLRGQLTPQQQQQEQKAKEKIYLKRKRLDDIIKENEADNFPISQITKSPLKNKIDPAPQRFSSKKHQAIEKYFEEEYYNMGKHSNIAAPAQKIPASEDMHPRLQERLKFIKKNRIKFPELNLDGIRLKLESAKKNIFYLHLTKGWKIPTFLFLIISFVLFSAIGTLAFWQKGMQVKGKVLGISAVAYKHLELAQSASLDFQYAKSDLEFQSAYQSFLDAENQLSKNEKGFAEIVKYLPIDSLFVSGNYLLNAGKNLSLAGQCINEGLADISKIKIMEKNNPSPTKIFEQANRNFLQAKFYFKKTENELSKVDISNIPQNFQNSLSDFQSKLPIIIKSLDDFNKSVPIILEALGKEHSQKYLLLFQNNHEMRASGGFIGTYGIIDVNEGKIDNIFIDGIYNPDGQLQEKVVPPRPIQKISAAWSMHDSNWFADFPASAKKIAWFYEKTGGPTVDGVIAVTPNVIEDLLKITGPINMPEYEMVIDENNFRELTQYEVEVNYNKTFNRPKKILTDLTPKLMNKIFNQEEIKLLDLLDVFNKNFCQKHILIYSFDPKIESFILEKGWGGQVLETNKDYLNVINSNINGYKTDGVIGQKIQHRAEIQDDGSIIDTLTITRTHRGGNSPYDWYNKVNANYLRVFVPKGSELLEVKGHTWEKYFLPMDYSNFSRDPDLEAIDKTLKEDELTGTHIFEESGKTVFGNWVYVSPGETVIASYKYKLPFKLDFSRNVESYGLLAQKQAGSWDVDFRSSFNIPQGWKIIKQVPSNTFCGSNVCQISQTLETDQFYGAVFEKNRE